MTDVKTVDARDMPCPVPVVRTKKALEEIEEGQVLVLVNSPTSCQNVQRFAESQGCKVTVEEKEGVFHLHIVKEKAGRAAPSGQSTDVVFITSDRLGTGDQRLGEILMKAFLNTLWDVEPKPAKILFLNEAVRLTTEGSEVLDSLRLLEKAGVQLLSCGTCLEYYHLRDDLRVGSATNMYDTVNSLLSAGKIIRV